MNEIKLDKKHRVFKEIIVKSDPLDMEAGETKIFKVSDEDINVNTPIVIDARFMRVNDSGERELANETGNIITQTRRGRQEVLVSATNHDERLENVSVVIKYTFYPQEE